MAESAGKLFDSATPFKSGLRGSASAALLCELAVERGLPLAQSLKDTGITGAMLRDPGGELSARQELNLIANILGGLGDPPGLGLEAGQRYRMTTYGVWGFAVLSSRTVREAVEIGLRFVDLTYALTAISGREQPDEFEFLFQDCVQPEPLRRFVLERDAAAALAIGSEVLGVPMPLRRLALRLPAPSDSAPYEAAFGTRPVFNARESVAAIERGLLDLPLPQASPLTAEACVQQCRAVLDRRRARDSTAGRVRDELLRDPRAMPSLEEIAQALHVSVRTLRRRLAEDGTGFRALVEETRELLAEELLATRSLTVEQVADRLGYAEASSFVHAFTRWKGVAPRRWQQAQAIS